MRLAVRGGGRSQSAPAAFRRSVRPAAILVRPGNPLKIRDLPDLARPGVKVLVVQGAGQTGLWEDMAGRDGDVGLVRALRRNMVPHAPNSAAAKEYWVQHGDVDAWIIYGIWQVANPALADQVRVGRRYVVYRDSGIALTRSGADRPVAREFVQFLKSKEGGDEQGLVVDARKRLAALP